MDKERPRVLFAVSAFLQAGFRFPELFHRLGFEVDLLSPPGLIHRLRHVRSLPEPPENLPALVERMRVHLTQHGGMYRHVFLGDDALFLALCQQADRDWMAPWFPVDVRGPWMEILCRKERFNRACVQHGILVPEEYVCSSLEEAQSAAGKLGFPVMLKTPSDAGGYGVRCAIDPASLEEQYQALTIQSPGALSVQQHISGQQGGFYVMARHGTVVQGYAFHRLHAWPGRMSPTSAMSLVESPDLEDLAGRVAGMTGFHGVFGLDWIRSDRDGRIYVLEMNPRPEVAMVLGHHFGLDVRAGLDRMGGTKTPSITGLGRARPGTVRLFPQDMCRSLEERDGAGIRANVADIVFNRADIPWGDPALLGLCFRRLQRSLRDNLQIGRRLRLRAFRQAAIGFTRNLFSRANRA
jgi:hypothetical protein